MYTHAPMHAHARTHAGVGSFQTVTSTREKPRTIVSTLNITSARPECGRAV